MEPYIDRVVDIAIEVRKQAPQIAQKIPQAAEKAGEIIEEGAQKVIIIFRVQI
jgi:hypothetical protein